MRSSGPSHALHALKTRFLSSRESYLVLRLAFRLLFCVLPAVEKPPGTRQKTPGLSEALLSDLTEPPVTESSRLLMHVQHMMCHHLFIRTFIRHNYYAMITWNPDVDGN